MYSRRATDAAQCAAVSLARAIQLRLHRAVMNHEPAVTHASVHRDSPQNYTCWKNTCNPGRTTPVRLGLSQVSCSDPVRILVAVCRCRPVCACIGRSCRRGSVDTVGCWDRRTETAVFPCTAASSCKQTHYQPLTSREKLNKTRWNAVQKPPSPVYLVIYLLSYLFTHLFHTYTIQYNHVYLRHSP